ncbi:hypothetical protein [Pelagicoccus sp. SDUM812003]|uniref:hypothetical protein n=1 Tax=Pelagicoccus sp. SDUM812003 TaxID=3041267 RepID=UPI00280FFD34|nr:hypothetical protein [Pelagicoccus sp. SDUM812003]MDQ8203838.1 hypothetical protein [Pelagicoccus sp. SDUM812003]
MNKLGRNLGIGFVGVSAAALLSAAPQNWELGVGYTTKDADIDEIDVQEDNFSLRAAYYFQSFDPSGRSIHEAPFIDRSSYVKFGMDIEELDDDIDNLVDTDVYSISGAWIDPKYGWYGKAAYVDADADISGGETPSVAVVGYNPAYDGYSLAVGKYVAENTTLELEYTKMDVEGDFFILDGAGGSKTDLIGLGFKHFGRLTDSIGFSFEGSYSFVDVDVADFDDLDDDPFDSSGEVYDFTFTVYPVRELAVGFSYSDADDLMGTPYFSTSSMVQDGFGLFGEWYFTESFSLSALYNDQSYDISNPDDFNDPGNVESDSLLFAAKYRF